MNQLMATTEKMHLNSFLRREQREPKINAECQSTGRLMQQWRKYRGD